jgi:hypothetical protein
MMMRNEDDRGVNFGFFMVLHPGLYAMKTTTRPGGAYTQAAGIISTQPDNLY